MKYKPLLDYLLIRPDEAEKTTESGIFIPESVLGEFTPRTGVVIAIGDKVERDFEEGTKVIYKIWGGNIVVDPEDPKKELIFVLEEDVLGVLYDSLDS